MFFRDPVDTEVDRYKTGGESRKNGDR